jgi:3-isopropylmalate dehydrogenase
VPLRALARSHAIIPIIPGDGIGVDVTHEAVKVLGCVAEESGIPLDLVEWDLGAQRYLDTGVSITPDEMDGPARQL